MATTRILQPSALSLISKCCRHSAPRISRPMPRSWTRRVYEEALKPTFDEIEITQRQRCSRPAEMELAREMENTVLPKERALANTIISEVYNAQVMGIFQRLPVDERNMHLDRMSMQSEGLGTRIVSPKIFKLVCESSTLQNLNNNLLAGDLIVLWANDVEKCKTIAKYSKKLHWILLLAAAVENRIMSAQEFMWFVENRQNLSPFQAKTCGLLQSPAGTLVTSLNAHSNVLTSTLENYCRSEKKEQVAD